METKCHRCPNTLNFPRIFEDPIQQLIEEFVGVRLVRAIDEVSDKYDINKLTCISCVDFEHGIVISRQRVKDIVVQQRHKYEQMLDYARGYGSQRTRNLFYEKYKYDIDSLRNNTMWIEMMYATFYVVEDLFDSSESRVNYTLTDYASRY